MQALSFDTVPAARFGTTWILPPPISRYLPAILLRFQDGRSAHCAGLPAPGY
jgi:hypothetical protein